ncbi:hypothetical protein TIFTF001_016444 [Ficus carica]|uniref:Uncharacterized protein n=1 Tax=Ficus carica TaxID=3494 RepID=A0AA88ATB7_FICCA|nr:hypothetical protein TIFTF001_016444 [Ficus carica]
MISLGSKVTYSNRMGYHCNAISLKVTCLGETSNSGFSIRFGPWFELDRAGRPNHSMAARQGTYTYVMLIVVLAERKLTTYVYAVVKYGNGLRRVGRYSHPPPQPFIEHQWNSISIFIFFDEVIFSAPPTFHRASMEVCRHLRLLRQGHFCPNLPSSINGGPSASLSSLARSSLPPPTFHRASMQVRPHLQLFRQ